MTDLQSVRDESAEAESLLLRIPEQRQVDPTHETEDREIGRLVAFGDRLDDPRRQEAQPQQPPHRALIQVLPPCDLINRIDLLRDQLERPSACAGDRLE